ncbi:hypothetical protein D9M71_515400 [compost metagenome]
MQAVPGQVEGQHRLAAIEVQVHAQVGVELVHRRPPAELGAQAVDDGVLDLQRAEVGVVDARSASAELHGEAAARVEVVAPGHGPDAHVELLGIRHRETRQHQQHPVGQARPQAQAVGGFQVAFAAHRGNLRLSRAQAELLGFLQQQAVEALRAGEEKFVDIRHARFPGPSPFQQARQAPDRSSRRFAAAGRFLDISG